VLFLSSFDVFWTPLRFPDLLVARAFESEFGIYWFKLSLAGGHCGFSLCPMDHLDVCLLLPTWPWSEKDTMPFPFRLPGLTFRYLAL
jgi:hypothetical protein